MHKKILLIVVAALILSACHNNQSNSEAQQEEMKSMSVLPQVTAIEEAYTTLRDESDNVDSPALWHGDDGQNWLLATAKEGNVIMVYDAATGEKINQFGQAGTALGDFSRPNGIAVIDNLAVVVERDNHRIQVFSLPELKPLGTFGESFLRLPYGLTIDGFEDKYHLFVTDNYETPDEETPPADSLGQRVHHFVFKVENNQVAAEHIKAFGDTTGKGVLYKVESLAQSAKKTSHIDQKSNNIKNQSYSKFIANYRGVLNRLFREPNNHKEVSLQRGIPPMLMRDVMQCKPLNVFIPKNYGGFGGEITRNTDGIAITQQAFGNFKYGAFYPVHNDGSLTAISWEDIAKTLGLKDDCN